MTTQLVQLPKPKAAKVIHNLTWEQFEELDRSLDAVREFRQVLRSQNKTP
jgi:hypothetical protein